jgi:hypothetical protein
MQLMQRQEAVTHGMGTSGILSQCLLSSGGLWIPDAVELPTWLSQYRVDMAPDNHDVDEPRDERAEDGRQFDVR